MCSYLLHAQGCSYLLHSQGRSNLLHAQGCSHLLHAQGCSNILHLLPCLPLWMYPQCTALPALRDVSPPPPPVLPTLRAPPVPPVPPVPPALYHLNTILLSLRHLCKARPHGPGRRAGSPSLRMEAWGEGGAGSPSVFSTLHLQIHTHSCRHQQHTHTCTHKCKNTYHTAHTQQPRMQRHACTYTDIQRHVHTSPWP